MAARSKNELGELIALAAPLIRADGFNETRIQRVRLYRSSAPIPRQPILYESWIVANLQGRKILHYADRTLHYDQNSILCVTSGSPVECVADASPDRPLVSIVLDVRMDELLGLAARMPVPRRSADTALRNVDTFPFTPELREVYGPLLRAAVSRKDALRMVKRRALAAGLSDRVCCHTFRATGITVFLQNGGVIERAQKLAGHESPRTTKLYDRTNDEISLDEVERILI